MGPRKQQRFALSQPDPKPSQPHNGTKAPFDSDEGIIDVGKTSMA